MNLNRIRYATCALILALAVPLLAQTPTPDRAKLIEIRDELSAIMDRAQALLASLRDYIDPPIPTVRVFTAQEAQDTLNAMALANGGVIEVSGVTDWDVRRTLRAGTQPLITIRGVTEDATIRGAYIPYASNVAWEHIAIRGNPGRGAHVQLGGTRHEITSPEQVPSGFRFSHVVMDGGGVIRTGIRLNARSVIVEDSTIDGYSYPGEDSNAISGWNGMKDVIIRRSRLVACTQSFVTGGSDAATEEMIPSDILIEDSDLDGNRDWLPTCNGKTRFELKNAKRVTVRRTRIAGVWSDAWAYAPGFKINVSNQEGTNPWATVEDFLMEDSIVENVGQYVNIVGSNAGPYPSAQARRITFRNNIFRGMHMEGDGRNVVVNDGAQEVLFDHNTFELNRHSYMEIVGLVSSVTFTNNIARYGTYGLRNQNASAYTAAGNLITSAVPTEAQIAATVTTDGVRVGAR